MRLKPKDIAILLDRLEVLFDKPGHISEGRDLAVRSELPIRGGARRRPPRTAAPMRERVGAQAYFLLWAGSPWEAPKLAPDSVPDE